MLNALHLKANKIIGDLVESSILLNSWKGFQSRQGPYCSKDNKLSNGEIKVFISGNNVDYVKVSRIEQVNAINFLYENQEKIKTVLLSSLQRELPKLREQYDDEIPFIEEINNFSSLIGLSNIHVLNSEKYNYAYVGYEFGCDWDEEHGLGIMTYKDQVISIGHADTAFDLWITFEDKGTIEAEKEKWLKEYSQAQKSNYNKPKMKRWWKFW